MSSRSNVIIALVGAWISTAAAASEAPVPATPATPVAAVEERILEQASPTAAPVVTAPAASMQRGAGWADRLEQRGFATSMSLTGLWIGDVSGGVKTGGVYNSLGVFEADADLAKLVNLSGGTLHGSVYWIRGRSASYEFVGDALVVSNLDGFDSIRLYELWAEQRFADQFAVRIGNQSVDAELAGTEYGAALTNGGFGWPASIAANVVNGGPIYYAPAFGARLAWQPSESWNAVAGVYDGDSFDHPNGDPLPNQHGVHWSLGHGQGAFAIAEVAHRWQIAEGAPGLAGNMKVGFWRHTAQFEDNRLDSNGAPVAQSGLDPALHAGNQGWYAAIEQRLWREGASAEQGLGGWLRAGGAPADRSAFEWVSDAGLHWTGLFPRRDADVLAIGAVHAQVSRHAAQAARDEAALLGQPTVVPDFERVFEIAYTA